MSRAATTWRSGVQLLGLEPCDELALANLLALLQVEPGHAAERLGGDLGLAPRDDVAGRGVRTVEAWVGVTLLIRVVATSGARSVMPLERAPDEPRADGGDDERGDDGEDPAAAIGLFVPVDAEAREVDGLVGGFHHVSRSGCSGLLRPRDGAGF